TPTWAREMLTRPLSLSIAGGETYLKTGYAATPANAAPIMPRALTRNFRLLLVSISFLMSEFAFPVTSNTMKTAEVKETGGRYARVVNKKEGCRYGIPLCVAKQELLVEPAEIGVALRFGCARTRRSMLFEQRHCAVIQIILGGHDSDFFLSCKMPEYSGFLCQAGSHGFCVGIDYALHKLAFLRFGTFFLAPASLAIPGGVLYVRLDSLDNGIDVCTAGTLPFCIHGGGDSSATLMSQYHYQWRSQMLGSIFDTPQNDRIRDVSGDPHNKNLTQALVKNDFRRDAGIGTGKKDGVWFLSFGQRGSCCGIAHRCRRQLVGYIMLVALQQFLQGLVR